MQVAKTEISRTIGATFVTSRLRPEVEVTRVSTAKNDDGPLLKGNGDPTYRAGTEEG